MSARGKFIVVEGIDGSGKTTLVTGISARLVELSKSIDVLTTREPTRHATTIRADMAAGTDENDDAEAYAKVFIADRKNHVQASIGPALRFGTHVVCDRYMGSTIAYQGNQGMDVKHLIRCHTGMPFPDLTIILDLPAEAARARREAAGSTDVFDRAKLDWVKSLRQRFLDLPQHFPEAKFVVVDATLSREEVLSFAMEHVIETIELKE